MSSTPSKSHGQTPTPLSRNGRKTGTQERPLETAFYDLLGVQVDATTDDIKRAYRHLTIKYTSHWHSDKNRRHDPNVAERLKSIAIAYQTLSDPQLRHKYNEFGPEESAPEGGFVDPEELFGLIFGGERFLPLIGQQSFTRFMNRVFQGADVTEGDDVAAPFQAFQRETRDRRDMELGSATWHARALKLVENLRNKLGIFTENATSPTDPEVTESWRRICTLEAEELKGEFYGVELLNAIGFVYTSKAKQFLKHHESFLGFGEILQRIYRMVSCAVSAGRLTKQSKAMFNQIQQGEVSGILSAEEKKHLEEQATEKDLQAVFKFVKVDIDWVLSETCERVLNDRTISPHGTAVLRAAALQTLGEAFMAVRNE